MKKRRIRKKTVAKILCVILALSMMLPFFSCMSRERTTIKIVYTGGVHGQVEADKGVVGSALTDAFVEKVRVGDADGTLVLDCGGFLYGRQMVNLTEGTLPFNILSETGYDALNVGPAELGYGGNRLGTLAEDYDLPVLSCNLYREEERAFAPYVIRQIGRVKVAIIGVLTDEAGSLSLAKLGVLTVRDPAEEVRAALQEIGNRADAVIVLSQLGEERSRALAEEVPGIDLLIDGLEGEALPSGEWVEKTLLCRPGVEGASVGLAEIELRGNQVYEMRTELFTGDDLAGETPSADIAALVATAKAASAVYLDETVGESAVILDGERASVRRQESNFGNLVADFARTRAGSDVALIPSENIRTSLAAGALTRRSVQDALPLDNALVRYSVTGEQLLGALEYLFTDYELEGGLFPQISGMQLTVNPSRPAGERVQNVFFGDRPVDPKRYYTVATVEHWTQGTAEQAVENPLAAIRPEEEYGVLTDLFITYLQGAGTVAPVLDGRLSVVTE